MFPFSHIRAQKLKPLLAREQAEYTRLNNQPEIAAWQLAKFNSLWGSIYRNVPFYGRLKSEINIPDNMQDWSQFSELLPRIDRPVVKENFADLTNTSRKPDYHRITGGSTSQPVQLPAWSSEQTTSTLDLWTGRSWFGIHPSDKLFLFWGHRHILGSGIPGAINKANRKLRDWLLGYHRFSAYDLSQTQLEHAADEMVRFKPKFVLGYASALDRFARINQAQRSAFHALNLKAVITTTESYPKNDSAEVISDVLGAPVTMEYGAIETGPIAQQRPDGIFQVFWRHHFIELVPLDNVPGAYEILVTSLYDRCFPLIRYAIGDLAEPVEFSDNGYQELKSVTGRSNDCIVLIDGATIHPQTFRDAISWCEAILDFQVIQDTAGDIKLSYVSRTEVSPDSLEQIHQKLLVVNANFQSLTIERVDQLETTVAGKTKRIIRTTVMPTEVEAS